MAWSKEWMTYLDLKQASEPSNSKKLGPCDFQCDSCEREPSEPKSPQKLDPCVLQFANCDRLEARDAVYIFDEVGCGKTISAGLMALHYLFKNDDKKVLVITDNALVKPDADDSEGQFMKDWRVLPFEKLGLKERIWVINNHCSNIKNSEGSWGLVIIDEVHVFLNKYTARYENLVRGIRADKVAFLTATPIKNDREDLEVYVEIAKAITKKQDLPVNWIKEICTDECGDMGSKPDPGKLICGKFDQSYPVTRYFKDTVHKFIDDKKGPVRLLPDTWKCYIEKGTPVEKIRLDTLLCQIDKLYQEDNKNRFLIFVRLVGEEAIKLGDHFKKHGFAEFKKGDKSGVKTVKVVTGNNSGELSEYQSPCPKDLPTVLIITYQIGERGVNLPGFNHVVNYHIPASPSSLEQRYGRIDRLTSKRKSVGVHYLILASKCSKDNGDNDINKIISDSNTMNFYAALSSYICNLLTCLPSKNVILTKELLDELEKHGNSLELYKKEILELAKSDEILKKAIKRVNSDEERAPAGSLPETAQKVTLLKNFISDNNIDPEDSFESIRKQIHSRLQSIKTPQQIPSSQWATLKNIFEKGLENKILFLTKKISENTELDEAKRHVDDIGGVNAAEDEAKSETGCDTAIRDLPNYTEYREEFDKCIHSAATVAAYLQKLEEAYEKRFMDNRLEDIFCLRGIFGGGGYSAASLEDYWKNCFNKKAALEICEEIVGADDADLDTLCDFLSRQYTRLPFFRMCKKFQELLIKTGSRRVAVNLNPWEQLKNFDNIVWNHPEEIKNEVTLQIKNVQRDPLQSALKKLTGTAVEDLQSLVNEIGRAADNPETYRVKMEGHRPKASYWLRLVYLLTGSVSAVTYDSVSSDSWRYNFNITFTTLFQGFLFTSRGLRRDNAPGFCSQDTTDEEWKQEFEKRGRLIRDIFDLDMAILNLDVADELDLHKIDGASKWCEGHEIFILCPPTEDTIK